MLPCTASEVFLMRHFHTNSQKNIGASSFRASTTILLLTGLLNTSLLRIATIICLLLVISSMVSLYFSNCQRYKHHAHCYRPCSWMLLPASSYAGSEHFCGLVARWYRLFVQAVDFFLPLAQKQKPCCIEALFTASHSVIGQPIISLLTNC